jgi:hypothetical protein
MIRADGPVQIFLVILGFTVGVAAIIFGLYLWEYYRIVLVLLVLMLVWYFMGKAFSRMATSFDIAREQADADLAGELAELEERSTAYFANNQKDREQARQETLQGMADSIQSLEEEIQGMKAEAELFELKLLRSNTAHEIFELKDIGEKLAELRKLQKGV